MEQLLQRLSFYITLVYMYLLIVFSFDTLLLEQFYYEILKFIHENQRIINIYNAGE